MLLVTSHAISIALCGVDHTSVVSAFSSYTVQNLRMARRALQLLTAGAENMAAVTFQNAFKARVTFGQGAGRELGKAQRGEETKDENHGKNPQSQQQLSRNRASGQVRAGSVQFVCQSLLLICMGVEPHDQWESHGFRGLFPRLHGS